MTPTRTIPAVALALTTALAVGAAAVQRPIATQGEPLYSTGWFGFGISCSHCSLESGERGRRWQFREPPEIFSVDRGSPADRAGLRRGDLLTHLDGLALTSERGGQLFGAVEPGQRVQLTYRRGAATDSVTLVAEEQPGGQAELVRVAQIVHVAQQFERLQSEQATQTQELSQQLLQRLQREQDEESRRLEQQLRERIRQLEQQRGEATQRLREALAQARELAAAPRLAATPQRLRYAGTVGGADVEVRGVGSVIVTQDEETGELVVTTGETTIRIRPTKKTR